MTTQTDNATTAQRLFYERFLVYVQNKAFYDEFELENIGFTSAGDSAHNEAYLNEFRLINTNIAQIAEWCAEGHTMRLYELKHASLIFNILNEHMDNWLNLVHAHPTVNLPPIEDFEAMDQLAEMLYPLVDLSPVAIEDMNLALIFGNALNYGFLVNDHHHEEGASKEPYEPYSPKLYGYSIKRWAQL